MVLRRLLLGTVLASVLLGSGFLPLFEAQPMRNALKNQITLQAHGARLPLALVYRASARAKYREMHARTPVLTAGWQQQDWPATVPTILVDHPLQPDPNPPRV